MQIEDFSRPGDMERSKKVIPEREKGAISVATEHWMEVYIQERPVMRFICTPEHLDELVIGRMLTEGIIRQPEEIEKIHLYEGGLRASILLREDAAAELFDKRDPAMSNSCTETGTLMLTHRRENRHVNPLNWEKSWVVQMAEKISQEEPLYTETHAVHSCCLASQNRILCTREDIGRHNAMDKAIGWACIHEIDRSQCLLFSTGRMPSDMVLKAIRSGIPLLASKTYPTDLGIQLAREACLTLITVRQNGDWIVWNDGRRTG